MKTCLIWNASRMHQTRTYVAAANNVAFFFTLVNVLVVSLRSSDVRFSNMSLQFQEALDRVSV